MQQKHLLAVATVWTLLIIVGCWLPAAWFPSGGPDLGGSFLPFLDLPLDKFIHFVMFLGFGFLWSLALGGRFAFLTIAIAGLALAILTEFGQSLPLIGREADLPDALADLVGLATGLVMAAFTRNWCQFFLFGTREA